MRKIATLFMVLGLLAAAAPALAVEVLPVYPSQAGIVADAPGATLLLPYFEVDLGSANGTTTLFSINNASATAVLAHVTVWSDLAVPVLAFNVYLTGYDVQAINMRDVIAGKLPVTASAGQDPGDKISHHGVYSQDINFASCSGQFPYPETLPAQHVTHLRDSLTGKKSALLGGCVGVNRGDQVARGFVTVDPVNNCTLRIPGDPGYIAPWGSGDMTNQNVFWGEFFIVKPNTKTGQFSRAGGTLAVVRAGTQIYQPNYTVHPPDNPALPDTETTVPGQYTFYGSRVDWTAADNRQPLGSVFGARYFTASPFQTATSLIVWRDPKTAQGVFSCGSYPDWYTNATAAQIAVFDQQEEVASINPDGRFPAATQRVLVGGGALPVPFPSGWLYLNLNRDTGSGNPSEDPGRAQSWVFVLQDTKGRFATGHPAMMIESAATGPDTLLPVGP